jgi:tripartite-type tricarboxylate transporter receptor subunit TctC
LGLAGALAAQIARAQSVADFYKSHNLTIVVGIVAGSTYDLSARLIARGMTRHLPGNPAVVVQNMHGANSIIAANYVYNAAPKDGSTIWTGARLAPFEPLFGNDNAKFDATKVRWLGSTASENGVVAVWHTAPHQTAKDLFEKELIVGATDPGGDTYFYPTALNRLLGAKFKLIGGYAGPEPIALAMERGEVQGAGSWSWSNIPFAHPRWLAEKKIRVLLQLGIDKHPDLVDVPLASEFAANDEQRQVLSILMGMKKFSFPFFAPPGVPADRAAALQKAFDETLRDEDFLADSKAQGRGVGMAGGAEVTEAYRQAYALPASVIQRAREVAR